MKKILLIWIFIFIIVSLGAVFGFKALFFSENKMETNLSQFEEKTRKPAVAGQFYPEDKKELKEMIKDYLAKAQPPEIQGEIFGLLLPHASYIFSGQVAAFGIKAIEGKSFDTVILIGDSHYERFEGVSIWASGSWETPLGKVKVDEELSQKILSGSSRFIVRDSAHLLEHSLEVEIPFLQVALANEFKIVPIIFGSEDEDWQKLAEVILQNIKTKKVLIIASSDLSHYPPYDKAKQADLETLKAVLKANPQALKEKISQLEDQNIPNAQTFMCAQDAVKTLLEIASQLQGKAKLLKYANSDDSPFGEKNQVVGYGAVAFFQEENSLKENSLSKEEKEELLKIAKESVESFVKTGIIPKFNIQSERLKKTQGAFVTLKKNGQLRGCIGYTGQDKPLYEVVSQMAIAAALEDHRFPPVTQEELPSLEYEISVLSPLKAIDSPDEIRLGIDGVQIVSGNKSALFLPQVATENNWDLETFLDHLMLKAGLWPGYWKKYPLDFYTFTAEVFGER